MFLGNVWELIEGSIFPIPSTDTLFNPYNGWDARYDRPDADQIRRENLRNYLGSFPERPSVLVVGEAPGPWGCRFSGVPFTSEAQLCEGGLPFAGSQSSVRHPAHRESSATILWRAMLPYYPRFLLWNCVPLHPHKPDVSLSIRTPDSAEVAFYSRLLRTMYEVLAPEIVVAVGRSAERALASVGVSHRPVRHPSNGGARLFSAGIEEILSDLR